MGDIEKIPYVSPTSASPSYFDEVADGTRDVTLAVVELRRELGDRVAAVDRGEDLECPDEIRQRA